MRLPRLLGTLALLTLGSLMSAGAADLKTPKGTVGVRERRVGSTAWICAQDLAKGLRGSFGRDEVSKYPTLVIEGRRLLVSTSTPLVSVEGKIVKLQQVPQEAEGCLWLPPEFLTDVLEPLLGGKVSLSDSGPPEPSTPARPPEGQAPAGGLVSVDCTVSGDAVRITLTGAAALSAEPRQTGQEVTLTLPSGRFAAYTKALGQGIVSRAEVDPDGKRLRVITGPGLRKLDHFKLRNPDRLVVVLTGESQQLPAEAAPEAPSPSNGAPSAAQKPPQKTAAFDLVAIDPGHGGSDTGAIGPGGLQEKDLTLVLAQKLAAELEKQGIGTVLTRNSDTLIPLQQRTAIANYNQADLFLSIHLNSSPAASAKGTETFYLSRQATDLWSSELAEKENASPAAPASGQGGVDLVLWELAQTSSIVESAAMAEIVQQEFNGLLGTKDRGVRQAPFVVLEGATMPAVLVEVAFLSNPGEAKKVADPAFQDQVASTLAKCVLAFKAQYENPSASPQNP
jgi:N-acetylmuramoyl-L-alanine amidase